MPSIGSDPDKSPAGASGSVEVLRPRGDLTASQDLFCRLWCAGHKTGDAYALAFQSEMTPEDCSAEGSKLLKTPKIVQVCCEILKAAKLEEIDNPQQAFRDLMADIDGARTDKNWSAVMAGHDKRLKAWGMLKDRQIIENVESLSDEQLVKELAGDDPQKQEAVRLLIGADKSA